MTYRPAYRGAPRCIVCLVDLEFRMPKTSKSGKQSIMLVCPSDARHFRAFINDQAYVAKVIDAMEKKA